MAISPDERCVGCLHRARDHGCMGECNVHDARTLTGYCKCTYYEEEGAA